MRALITSLLLLGYSLGLLAQAAPDLELDSTYFVIPENAIMYPGFAEPQHFLVRVRNVGDTVATDFTVSFSLTDPSTVFYTAEQSIEQLLPGEAIDVLLNEAPIDLLDYIPNSNSFDYVYEVSMATNEVNDTNNRLSSRLNFDQRYFAKENGRNTSLEVNTPGPFVMGNCFYFNTEPAPRYYNTYAFMLDNAAELVDSTWFGGTIVLYLCESDGDMNEDGMLDSTEYVYAYFNEYQLDGSETQELIHFPLDLDGYEPVFQVGKYYLALLYYYLEEGERIQVSASDAFDYSATAAVSEAMGTPQYAGLYGDYPTRFSSFPIIQLNAFGADTVPIMRIAHYDPIDVDTPRGILPADYVFTIQPNPVDQQMNVAFNFPTPLSLSLRLFDTRGREVRQVPEQIISTQNISIDCADLSSGTYFLRVYSDQGTRSKTVVVQH